MEILEKYLDARNARKEGAMVEEVKGFLIQRLDQDKDILTIMDPESVSSMKEINIEEDVPEGRFYHFAQQGNPYVLALLMQEHPKEIPNDLDFLRWTSDCLGVEADRLQHALSVGGSIFTKEQQKAIYSQVGLDKSTKNRIDRVTQLVY